MKNKLHSFHIPVMGTGHSIDTPIRVAHFGITSVISLCDDIIMEKIRKYYCGKYGFDYEKISTGAKDGRAERIRAYLDLVGEIVKINMEKTRNLPFFENNDKKKYFELLPLESPLKKDYIKLINMEPGRKRDIFAEELTQKMAPGSIDVNIMVKVDKTNYGPDGAPLPDEFSDAKAALRGFVKSSLESSIVFSAGINKSLFTYMSTFPGFYCDESGKISKKIVIKVSDFRSAQIQGRFLAKKGLLVHEYRIESGLNCGGHAFATNGLLLPAIMEDFLKNTGKLASGFNQTVKKYYNEKGLFYDKSLESHRPLITVQGGIGVSGEAQRLLNEFKMDMTGWASPFLLVPEATPIDLTTRKLLEKSGEKDLYLSKVSPLGVPFNNVHECGSEKWTLEKAAKGNPGSPCPRRYLVSNREFTQKPICPASSQYQKKKLREIDNSDLPESQKKKLRREVINKFCLCGHLGSGALISLGIAKEENSPQLICPGPNIEWFNRSYSLKEMVDHIYGRIPSLVPAERPHMFAKELTMYVDYFEKMVRSATGEAKEEKAIRSFKDNLLKGMELCENISKQKPYPGENLVSLSECVAKEKKRLKSIYMGFKRKMKLKDFIEDNLKPGMKLSPVAA